VETTFTDACYHLLRVYGFADTFLAAGGEDSAASFSFHDFEGARYWAANHHMAGRIDWILTLDGASSVQTTECLIARRRATLLSKRPLPDRGRPCPWRLME
jgi:hypothetical protein